MATKKSSDDGNNSGCAGCLEKTGNSFRNYAGIYIVSVFVLTMIVMWTKEFSDGHLLVRSPNFVLFFWIVSSIVTSALSLKTSDVIYYHLEKGYQAVDSGTSLSLA